MKTINVTFDDQEYKDLIKAKEGMSWHDFILLMTRKPKYLRGKETTSECLEVLNRGVKNV